MVDQVSVVFFYIKMANRYISNKMTPDEQGMARTLLYGSPTLRELDKTIREYAGFSLWLFGSWLNGRGGRLPN
jgi:hypothetical protein